jgi:PRTRC genetic system ThiF family protein
MTKKGKKFKGHRGTPLPRTPQPPKPAEPPPLNLGFHEASVVATREYKNVQIVVAGCGGIGAYVVQHVGRLMRVLYDDQKGVNLTLVDPDIVKEQNLGRQLFCDAELGESKAVALARRYGQAWGLQTMVYVSEYSESVLMGADLTVLVGCVDNPAGRAALSDTLKLNTEEPGPNNLPKVWWLDCGNVKDTGRVLLGSASTYEQLRGSFKDKRMCINLPSPAMQYPSLLIPERGTAGEREMSCAERAAANLQSLNINAAIAVQASDFLTRLLITHDLKRYACAVNVASGSSKSLYVTPEEIARETGKSVDYLMQQPASARMAEREVVEQQAVAMA